MKKLLAKEVWVEKDFCLDPRCRAVVLRISGECCVAGHPTDSCHGSLGILGTAMIRVQRKGDFIEAPYRVVDFTDKDKVIDRPVSSAGDAIALSQALQKKSKKPALVKILREPPSTWPSDIREYYTLTRMEK